MPEPHESTALVDKVKPSVLNPRDERFEEVLEQMSEIDRLQFGESDIEALRERLLAPGTTTVVLRDESLEKVVGYVFSVPFMNYKASKGAKIQDIQRDDEGRKTAYLVTAAILPEYTRQGLGGVLLREVEEPLRQKRYEHMEFLTTRANGWADKVKLNYADRLEVEPFELDHEGNPHLYFRIKL